MLKLEDLARVAHEANRAFCEAHGDFSHQAWDRVPVWQRESMIHGVDFNLSHPDAEPGDQHENWMREKVDNGWVYGAEKSDEAKTHPCLIPWEELPLVQKSKDVLFQSIVRGMAPFVVDFIGGRRV